MTSATFDSTSNRLVSGPLAVLAGCLLAGGLGVAQAASPAAVAIVEGVPTVVVNYSDLNLGTNEGNVALYQRIAAAARQVCPLEDARNLSRAAHSKECRADAIGRAVRAVNSPQLAALYAVRTHRG